MIAARSVVMLLMSIRSGSISAAALFSDIVHHLELYKACYWDAETRPEHHYALHLPDMLRRFVFFAGDLYSRAKTSFSNEIYQGSQKHTKLGSRSH